MLYTIYKITNNINGKIYIGKHQTKNPNDSYYGSGKFIKAAIKKHGRENFTKEVLFVFSSEKEMNAKEKELITEEFVSRNDTYNAGIGGEGGPHFKYKQHGTYMNEINTSDAHRKKVSDGLKKAFSNGHEVWNKGKIQTEEHNEKISAARKNKKHSPETIEKIRLARKRQSFSEETKKKMSDSAMKRNNTSGPVA